MGVSDASRLSDLSDRVQALNHAIATLIAAPPTAAPPQRPPPLQKQNAAHGHGLLGRPRPSERRRRRRRKTAEAVAARELRQQQASTAAAIPLAAFARVQRHAATGGFMCGGIWHTRAALEARGRAPRSTWSRSSTPRRGSRRTASGSASWSATSRSRSASAARLRRERGEKRNAER